MVFYPGEQNEIYLVVMYGEFWGKNFRKISGERNFWCEVEHVSARPHFFFLTRCKSFVCFCACLVFKSLNLKDVDPGYKLGPCPR